MDVVGRTRDELVSRLKVLFTARQRLIEAEAHQGPHGHVAQPSTTGADQQLAGHDGASEPSSNDGSLPASIYLRDLGAPTTEPSINNVDSLHQTDEGPTMPMVIDQDTEEDFNPSEDDAPSDERSEQDTTMQQPAGGRSEHDQFDRPLCPDGGADSELWDDDIQEPIIHPDVATEYAQANSTMDFGQDYRDYVSGCVPSAATIAGTAENQSNQGSGGHDDNGCVVDCDESGPHLPHDNDPAVSGDDFYPLDEPEDAFHQRENHWYYQVYDSNGEQVQLDDIVGHLLPATGDDDASGDYGGRLLHLELYNNDDDDEVSEEHIRQAVLVRRLHVPHIIEDSPNVVFNEEARGGGFGGVPASAAAIAGLKKQKYDGSSGADGSRCVICMRNYKKGKRLVVMPCEFRHRFHGKCLRKWLSRSHLCPLCRHAMPTEEEQQDVRVCARV